MSDDDEGFWDEEDAWYWEDRVKELEQWTCFRCATKNADCDEICHGCGMPRVIAEDRG